MNTIETQYPSNVKAAVGSLSKKPLIYVSREPNGDGDTYIIIVVRDGVSFEHHKAMELLPRFILPLTYLDSELFFNKELDAMYMVIRCTKPAFKELFDEVTTREIKRCYIQCVKSVLSTAEPALPPDTQEALLKEDVSSTKIYGKPEPDTWSDILKTQLKSIVGDDTKRKDFTLGPEVEDMP